MLNWRILGSRVVISCFLILLARIIIAQDVLVDSVELATAIVKALPLNAKSESVAAPVVFLGPKDLERIDGVVLTSLFNSVPGVNWQMGNLNTQRITIRGVGSRSQFSTSRVKAYFGGIPISNAEGETVLDAIDLELIGAIEIIKGPSTSSFGAGMGGVISIQPKRVQEVGSYLSASSTLGSFGLQRMGLGWGSKDSLQSLSVGFNTQNRMGFRQNSEFERQALHFFGERIIGSNATLKALVLGVRLKAYIPSSISERDYRERPSIAAANWLAAEGYESYDQLIMGLEYQKVIFDNWNWNTSLFTNLRQSYEPRPFDILKENNNSKGVRSVLTYTSELMGQPLKLGAGIEGMIENYNSSLFRNLYQSQQGVGSVEGPRFSSLVSVRQYMHSFLEGEWIFHPRWKLEAGLAYNNTQYNLLDAFNKGDLYSHSFGSVFLPRISGSFKIVENQFLWISAGKGFSVPTVAESLLAEGKFNSSLQPEFGKSYELGYRGWAFKRSFYWNFSFYSMPVTNLLVATRLAEDQYEGRNAGASLHRGFEYSLHYRFPIRSKWIPVLFGSGTLTRFVFMDFVEGDLNFAGNFLPALPSSQHTLGASLLMGDYWRSTLTYQYFGKMFLNDGNSASSDSYGLWDVNVIYKSKNIKKLPFELFGGVNNLLDVNYAASVLPNATSFGNSPPRYFYPGPPRQYYLGLRLTFLTSSGVKGLSK
jgi:iron complex outermembrane receptor protein